VSERRNGGVREFVFSDAPLRRGADSGPPRLSRALMTARAFAWADDLPAANDASFAADANPIAAPTAPERDFDAFLRQVRQVYRGRARKR